MGSLLRRTLFFSVAVVGLAVPAVGRAAEPTPPKGFRAIFNGRDLTGWHGLNPHGVEKLTGEKKEADLAQQRADFPKNWTVENGELVNDGHGPYATTDEEFGDIELLIDYKTVPKADSGIYLRGTPQVQIWDWQSGLRPESAHAQAAPGFRRSVQQHAGHARTRSAGAGRPSVRRVEPVSHPPDRRPHLGLAERQARRRRRRDGELLGPRPAAAAPKGRSCCRRTAAKSAGETCSSATSAPRRRSRSSMRRRRKRRRASPEP